MNKKGFTITELLLALGLAAFFLTMVIGNAAWTSRNLDFWLGHLKGHAVHINRGLCLLLSIIAAPAVFALNIIGEIARQVV